MAQPTVSTGGLQRPKRPSPGEAKAGHALDFVIPQNPVLWDVAWFSFVPDGTRFVSRSFYPPINRWAIFGRPCGTSSTAFAFIRAIPVIRGYSSLISRPLSLSKPQRSLPLILPGNHLFVFGQRDILLKFSRECALVRRRRNGAHFRFFGSAEFISLVMDRCCGINSALHLSLRVASKKSEIRASKRVVQRFTREPNVDANVEFCQDAFRPAQMGQAKRSPPCAIAVGRLVRMSWRERGGGGRFKVAASRKPKS